VGERGGRKHEGRGKKDEHETSAWVRQLHDCEWGKWLIKSQKKGLERGSRAQSFGHSGNQRTVGRAMEVFTYLVMQVEEKKGGTQKIGPQTEELLFKEGGS